MVTLQDLQGLQRVDKVIVIWNSSMKPPANASWPDMGIPLAVSETFLAVKHVKVKFNPSVKVSLSGK